MNFRTYRESKGWTLAYAAELLGIADASTVARHEIGASLPKVELLAKYERLTGGDVTAEDFIAARRQFRADPAKARAKIGARTIERERATPT